MAEPVVTFDDALQQLIDDMFDTMYDAAGIGLAATQVNVHRRVVVLDLSEAKNAPVVLINPEIVATDGDAEGQEGCLSIPGVYETIPRAAQVSITAQDRDGESRCIDADELLAVAIQHEIDHLDGKMFVDYLSPLKRDRIRKKMLKLARERG